MSGKYRCIHCDDEFDTLQGSWDHEDENGGHKVWIKQEFVEGGA